MLTFCDDVIAGKFTTRSMSTEAKNNSQLEPINNKQF